VAGRLIDGMFGIKLVWPGWFEDLLAIERIGFPAGYDQRFDIPIGSKMFIYVTEYQRIMAVNQVIGTWEDGRIKYSPTGKFPLCLPIDSPFKANYGMGLKEIQRIVPRFIPKQGLSFFPISEVEYIDLEKKLIING
jgi:hypothetical protein